MSSVHEYKRQSTYNTPRFALVVAASLSTWQCGNVTVPLVDAHEPDAHEPDAHEPDAPAARACDTSQPFGAPVPIAEINSTAHDEGGWLSSHWRSV